MCSNVGVFILMLHTVLIIIQQAIPSYTNCIFHINHWLLGGAERVYQSKTKCLQLFPPPPPPCGLALVMNADTTFLINCVAEIRIWTFSFNTSHKLHSSIFKHIPENSLTKQKNMHLSPRSNLYFFCKKQGIHC
ncbi:calcium-binding protein 1 [Platysternon megacephalum]|uniref:Calcium-binding protein 1 n=1 Tax=Platysternon megacephalum TaxID=55544 RepID=A0A4D9DY14_9SAUR|nr:calcium-binding protein 1 [Platysternon megacephalum]